MKKNSMKTLINKLLIMLSLINFELISIRSVKSQEKNLDIKVVNTDIDKPRYLLGPGDVLQIRIFKMKQFNSIATVLPDGTVNLPRISSLQVKGINLDEAKVLITREYEKIIINPLIYINLLGARQIRVSVIGEVNRPGIYVLNSNKSIGSNNFSNDTIIDKNIRGWPSPIDAIQKAGGITPIADLRNIYINRAGKSSNKINNRIKINYLDSLKNGTNIKNHYIYDGDSIVVQKIKDIQKTNPYQIQNSNLSPKFIIVNVIGEVVNPGQHEVRPNATIEEALLIAGGLTKKGSTNIRHLRLKNDGSVSLNNHTYNQDTINKKKIIINLHERDIVIVKQKFISKKSDQIKELLEPASAIVSGVSLYKMFD